MTWTRFYDMHSGGGQKEAFSSAYIEAPTDEAIEIFFDRFGHHPEHVTCECCGEDYAVHNHETLEDASAYDRSCAYNDTGDSYVEEPNLDLMRYGASREECEDRYRTVAQYTAQSDILVIRAEDL